MAKLCACGVVLRAEIDAQYPKGDNSSDGWIGDASHQASKSDHNPDSRGIVHAIDVDKDGVDVNRLIRILIKDSRIQYVIYNRTIWSRTYGFESRKYTGKNPHTDHVHVSFRYGTTYENDKRAFGVKIVTAPPKPKPPVKPKPPTKLPVVANGTRTIRLTNPMTTGTDIKFIQTFIGCDDKDGWYGPATVARVKWYQRMRGIKVDGVWGKQCWAQVGVKYRGK